MKHHFNPYIIPAIGMMIVLLVAVSVFYRNTSAGKVEAEISVEEARKIALNDAGESADQVTFTRTILETEEGIPVYEVDFYTDQKKYEYEINARTGSVREKETVLKKHTDNRQVDTDNTKETVNNTGKDTENKKEIDTTNVIGVKKAQKIVLKDAGFSAGQVKFIRTELETDDGLSVYEIKFLKDGKEYEYEVNAVNGDILEADVDVEESRDSDDQYDDQDDDDDDDDRYDDDNDDDDDDDNDDNDNDDDDDDDDRDDD